MQDATATATQSEAKPQSPKNTSSKGLRGRWREMDWFARLGWLIAICLGLIEVTSFFFPWVNSPKPDLSCTVFPIRTAIVQASEFSDLAVTYKGQSVTGNVTAAQVALWNAGRESIRADDVLESVFIYTPTNVHILDVKLAKVTRGVTQFTATQFGPSQVELDWKILEKDDGALLQIVYAGSDSVPIGVKGIVAKQGEVTERKPVPKGKPGSHTELVLTFSIMFLGLFLVLIGSAVQPYVTKKLRQRWSRVALINRIAGPVGLLTAILLCSVLWLLGIKMINVITSYAITRSPFGF